MKPAKAGSAVLTVRVSAAMERRLAREARRRRTTVSAAARELLDRALADLPVDDPDEEARRQSRLASARHAEQDVLDFVAHAADLRGWK